MEQDRVDSERRASLSPCGLGESEIMTVLVHYHQAGYRAFKGYYGCHVTAFLKGCFQKLLSYQRFIELMPCVLLSDLPHEIADSFCVVSSLLILAKPIMQRGVIPKKVSPAPSCPQVRATL